MHTNCSILTLLIILLVISKSEVSTRSDESQTLSQTNDGSYGTYAATQYCNDGEYAIGFKMKIEPKQASGVDDTSANSLSLLCASKGDTTSTISEEITSNAEGAFGSWSNNTLCPSGTFITGFDQKVEPKQASGVDDTTLNSVQAICSDGTTIEPSTAGTYGTFTGTFAKCSVDSMVCGQSLKVEGFQGSGDDTALNGVKLYCCSFQTCSVIGNEVVGGTSPNFIQVTNKWDALTFTNSGTDEATTTTMGSEKCVTKSSTFTHTAGATVGVGVSFGLSASIGYKGLIDVGANFGMQFSSSLSSSTSVSTTVESQVCQSLPAQDYPCPARTTCQRNYIVYEPPATVITLNVSLSCSITGPTYVVGRLIASGAASIIVTDTQHPLDCAYYSDDYYDRSNGQLPFCDTCNSGDSCEICRDYYVKITNNGKSECVTEEVCVEDCKGTIGGGTGDGLAPYKRGYCNGEDLSLNACCTSLKNVFNDLTNCGGSNESTQTTTSSATTPSVTIIACGHVNNIVFACFSIFFIILLH